MRCQDGLAAQSSWLIASLITVKEQLRGLHRGNSWRCVNSGVVWGPAATSAALKTVRGDVLGLAPHTVTASMHTLRARGLSMQAHLFIPVFPIRAGSSGNDSDHGKNFVLQGLFEPRRCKCFTAPN